MKIVNKTGYLKGAKTAKNPVNIIPSSLITTQGMAFPIKANGKTLYPNTGQYKFPTSPVVETPLKQQGAKNLEKMDGGKAFLKLAKKVYNKTKPYIKKGLKKTSIFLVNDLAPKLPSGSIKDHVKGLGYGINDIIGGRKFSETFPITKSQKEKIDQIQQKAYDEGLQFSKDWYYGSNNNLRPEVREKISSILPQSLTKTTNLNIAHKDNPIVNTPGHLVSTRKGKTVLKNTNKTNEKFFKKHTQSIRGEAAGVHYGDAHLTFKNHGFYARKPEDIMHTVIHEHGGHSGQKFGVSEWNPIKNEYERTIWGEYIADKSSGKPLANASTELGKKMEKMLSDKDWYNSPLELHAEIMPLRKKMYDAAIEGGLSHEEAMEKLHNPSEKTLSTMVNELGSHFKPGTKHSLRKEIIKVLPAFGGIGAAGVAAQEKKNGSKLIKYKNGSKSVSLAFSRGEKDPKGGLTQKGVDKYNRATGGNLKMAVTTPPSKLKPGSKAAKRRKSFCARMSGVKGPMRKPNGKPTRKARALRKWNC
jgi:hypothetical protein